MAKQILNNYSDDSRIKQYMRQELMTRVFHDIPINVLNTGSFSILSEYISQITEQLAFTSTFYFNESFITKAVLPDSIYAEAAIFNLGYAFATPSTTKILLELRLTDLVKNATYNPNTGYYEFILDKDTQFNLSNGNVYSLDYDILFQCIKNQAGDIKGWNVQYTNIENNMCAVNKNRYIVYRVTDIWMCLFVTVSEYKRMRYIVTNTSTNDIPNEDYLIEINDHICGFDVTYIDPDGNRTPLRQDHILPIHDDVKDLDPYVHYIMDNPNVIRLMFQMGGKRFFTPKLNSQYEIIVYTSHGMSGNFTEAPTEQPKLITATSKYANNANVMKAAFCVAGSLGGTDIGTAETVRRETIEAYNTVNVISTDHDIDEYFKTFYFKNVVYPYFFKRRDDPWGRIWGGYLALKDEENHIYKTNTLHGNIPYEVLNNNNDNTFSKNEIIIPAGWTWVYQDDNRYTVTPYVRNTETNVIETVRNLRLNDDNSKTKQFIFANPFGIKIQKDPFAIAYFNPWIHTVAAPTYVENMNVLSIKDADDESALYHATPIDVEITRNYKNNFYRLETYIDTSQLKTNQGEMWVKKLLINMTPPEINEIVYTYFKTPIDLYADTIPMMIRSSDDGTLSFDPTNTFLCVSKKNVRDDGNVTLTNVWIQDNTNPDDIKTISMNITNMNYLFGSNTLWGEQGQCEGVQVVSDTRILCNGIGTGHFVEFVRSSSSSYYMLKLKNRLFMTDPDTKENLPIHIESVTITVDAAKKSERTAFGEEATYTVGRKYQNVKLNMSFKYLYVTTQEDEDGNMIDVESGDGGVFNAVYTIQNAVDVCLPYQSDYIPGHNDELWEFTYPITSNAYDTERLEPGTILAYATMKAASSTKTVDYYRIPFSELQAETPMFYIKTNGMALDQNNMRVILHAYINGSETGRTEMLPVSRDDDGTYLFQADLYPLNDMLDVDNLIHIASLEYGGGNWKASKSGTMINIDAIHPELRISILFKSTNNPDRVSDIEPNDMYTGYIRCDQYYVTGFSLVQELKEMRSVVNFAETSIPSTEQLDWYRKLMQEFNANADVSLSTLLDLIHTQELSGVLLTDEKRGEVATICEDILNRINSLVSEVTDDRSILPYDARVKLTTGWNRIVDVLTILKGKGYVELPMYSNEKGIVPCYVKTIKSLSEKELLSRAYEQFKDDRPKWSTENDEMYEERIAYAWTSRMQSIYVQEVKESLSDKDYTKFYADEDCTIRINPVSDVFYCVHEDTTIDRIYTLDDISLVYQPNHIVWENLADIIDGYTALIKNVFESQNVNGGLEIQLMPFVEYSLMNSDKFKDFVSTFTQVHKALEPVIFKRLEGNHYLDCKLMATYGLPHSYCSDKQYKLKNGYWPDLSVQISFDVKLYNRALSVNTISNLRQTIQDYFNRLTKVHMPKQLVTMNNNIYVSHLIQEMMEADKNVAYLKFNGWYTNEKNIKNGNYMDPSVQAIVMKWRKLEDMPTDELERYVPEMFVLEDQNIEINVIDDDILA